jgi:hypothetical protein
MPESTARLADIAGHGQPRAFALVAACCRRPLDAAAIAAVRAGGDKPDWPAVLGLARRHRVEALAQEAFAAAGINAPPSVAARLAARTHDIARRNLVMRRTSCESSALSMRRAFRRFC